MTVKEKTEEALFGRIGPKKLRTNGQKMTWLNLLLSLTSYPNLVKLNTLEVYKRVHSQNFIYYTY